MNPIKLSNCIYKKVPLSFARNNILTPYVSVKTQFMGVFLFHPSYQSLHMLKSAYQDLSTPVLNLEDLKCVFQKLWNTCNWPSKIEIRCWKTHSTPAIPHMSSTLHRGSWTFFWNPHFFELSAQGGSFLCLYVQHLNYYPMISLNKGGSIPTSQVSIS